MKTGDTVTVSGQFDHIRERRTAILEHLTEHGVSTLQDIQRHLGDCGLICSYWTTVHDMQQMQLAGEVEKVVRGAYRLAVKP